MIKESKYIIRRIIIGVGIVLVLGLFNGCKVKALELFNGKEVPDVPSVITDNDYPFYINGFATNDQLRLVYTNDNNLLLNSKTESSNINMAYGFKSKNNYFVYMCYSPCTSTSSWVYRGTTSQGYDFNTYSDRLMLGLLNSEDSLIDYRSQVYFNKNILFSNNNIANDLSLYSAYLPITQPEFLSWHSTKITYENLLTGYYFSPEFSIWDTDKFSYSYKFNNSNWLSLTENEQNIRINANGTIYVQVKDKESNELIDSATFTVTKIGQFVDSNIEYKIKFSGEYRTENYINNQITSSSSSLIKEYQIYIDYLPKSSILKYQYQWVSSGDSLDSSSWIDLTSSENGSKTYVATENGTLYARILDSEDNVLYNATFTVESIGLLAFDNNEEGVNNFFTKLSSKINYGGPVSALFKIPVDILSKFYNKAAINTCSPYKLSTLLGTDFYLPCIDFKEKFGNTVYTLFDSMLCILFSLKLFKFIMYIYNKFVSLEEVD